MHKNATPADIEAHPKFASLQSRFASQDPEWEILQRLGPAQAEEEQLAVERFGAWDPMPLRPACPGTEIARAPFCTSHVKGFDKSRNGLFPVRADSALGLIFVNVNGESRLWLCHAPPLSEWLGDLLPSLSEYESSFGVGTPGLVPYKRKQYDVPANWKLLVENYLEYYHLPAVHPDSATIPPFPTLRPRHQRMAYHATFLSHRAAFDAPGGEAVLEDMFQFWDLINTQDIDIVKNETLHRFQNMVIDKMLVHEPTRYRIPDGDVDYHDLLAAPDPLLPAAASSG
ncbi:hypothetical protein EMIHUDRAFT_239944 [Emiliania huxleyi CCMP1516]|uniref:Choline monooxygenase, chloroplastic n=2 Tax=Emiliania huxleyi TaxID=2903 RepID=A0A0D3JIA4_EMIH1|nr:hypothetical protein EMIHUDRAFT_239944 [Emiliania huxleyi CCMP1516]EOD23239.1 hypothetical protein EMIHUDRAFT_239944 [Emiliania huxleyi CCMP1516]|eukprot:XP_005775668.1 hypothetical protein EMIHUDRAFT_239944 [Emiliania huxleyi CCMP1516]